jgi:phosphoribosylaminoimidazole-succinocarboxamide synthase
MAAEQTSPTSPMRHVQVEGLRPFASGKVREIFDLGNDLLLFVATDRISAFDVILPTPIPGKGRVLTKLSEHWMRATEHIISNHLTGIPVADVVGAERARDLDDRALVVRKGEPLKIEAIVRGYLAGSGWSEYQKVGSVCGIKLPSGLRMSDRLPEPIFTPSTKAEIGDHDLNISFDEACTIVGRDLATRVRNAAIAIYKEGTRIAEERGIMVADTKFEFGIVDGELRLIDEVLTPDSSRFWDRAVYAPGAAQPSYDKQYVRDWLDASGWDRKPPAPELPPEVVAKTAEKYEMALRRLTGAPSKRS